jgi:hypothetical protein
VRDRGFELRCRVERLSEVEAVIEYLRVDGGGGLQVRDRLGWVVGEPEGDSEMVLRRSEFGIDCECSLEVGVGFVAAVEDGEEEADLVLYAGGVGVERGGLLPGGKCGGSVTSGAGGGGLGFQVAELLRLLSVQRG